MEHQNPEKTECCLMISSEAKSKEEKTNPKGHIVLQVYIHCQGCEEAVVKSLRGYDGVERIEVDAKNDKVIVKGEKADPIKVAKRLEQKTGKIVKLISPLPSKDKKEEKKPEKKEPKVVEVVLKVNLHCEGCANDVKRLIHKIHGVYTVEPDMQKNQVTVKGAIEPQKLVEYVKKKTKKHAEIVKPEKQNENKKEHGCKAGGGDGEKQQQGDKNATTKECLCCYHKHNYSPELVYAPQLFSDENPNACSIM